MSIVGHSHLIASGLVLLVGVASGLGGIVLYGGKPPGWSDVVASDAVLRRVSIGLLLTSVLMQASAIAGMFRVPGSRIALVAVTLLFVVGGFWGNYAVFGEARPLHTGANVAIAAIILWMLWQA